MVVVVAEVRVGVPSLPSLMASLGNLEIVLVVRVSRAEVLGDSYFDDGALAFTADVVFMSLSLEGNTASIMSPIM